MYIPYCLLTANVPDGHGEILELHLLDIEPNGRDGGDDLVELQLVQDGGLPGGVQPKHADAGRRRAEQAVDKVGKEDSHNGAEAFLLLPKLGLLAILVLE